MNEKKCRITGADKDPAAARNNERFSLNNFIKICFHIWRQFDDEYYVGFAAQIAYFFFMASMPTIIVLSQLLGIFDISLDFIKGWFERHIDSNVSRYVMGLFDAPSVRLTNVFMVILALWAASSLVFSLSRLTSYTLSEGAYKFNFWTERLKAIPTVALVIISITFSLVIFVYGEQLFNRVFAKSVFLKILFALKIPIAGALFFSMVLVNYYLLPRIRVPIRSILPGAAIASVGIMLVTVVYGLYIGYVSNYNILYGSFANIVALMLWFYLISWVLCIGMMFNKAWDDVMRRGRLTKEKMITYLEKQLGDDRYAYKKFFVLDDDKQSYTEDSIAVRMSRRFAPDYPDYDVRNSDFNCGNTADGIQAADDNEGKAARNKNASDGSAAEDFHQ